MTGPMPVFVHADDPSVHTAVVDALARQDGLAAVDVADAASWIVLTTSEDVDAPRVVAFVTAVGTTRCCHVVGPTLDALATGAPPGRDWSSSLPRAGVTRLGSALVRTAGQSALTTREEAVVRLVAQGHTTAEVAAELSYSERSVKNVIQGVTERLDLRNRCHVVAHAVREGWI
jgi:DNA-binding NarL/FixJ family response regulator